MRSLHVHSLPLLTSDEQLADVAVVVIDVLRASTTICHALAAGARQVIPCLEVDEARRVAATHPAADVVLGGERQGVKIAGFDLGNSPDEYTPAAVGDRTVLFTTTNGTRAMQLCRKSSRVLIGAFVNAAAVCETLQEESDVHLLCAGTRGGITREDVLLAGLLAKTLLDASQDRPTINDEARCAIDVWCRCEAGGRPLAEELADTQGGANLTSVGLAADIKTVARRDCFTLVPVLDVPNWSIRLP